MDVVLASLASLAINAPLYLVWLAGIVLAVVRRPRHPRVSLCITIALVVLLLVSISATIFAATVPLIVLRNGWTASQLGAIFAFVNGSARLIDAAAWVLVLVAAFGWRGMPVEYGSRA